MNWYSVKIEPHASADGIYIKLQHGGKQSEEVQVTVPSPRIQFDNDPQEIIVRRHVSFIKRMFTSFYCKYIEVSSSTGSVFYFPVFKNISTEKENIEEGSGKLPWEDDPLKREEGMKKKISLQNAVGWNSQQQESTFFSENRFSLVSLAEHNSNYRAVQNTTLNHRSIMTERVTIPKISPPPKSFKERLRILAIRMINFIVIFGAKISSKLDTVHKCGLPSYMDDGGFFKLPPSLWFGPFKLLVLVKSITVVGIQNFLRRFNNFGYRWRKIDDIKRVFLFPSKKAVYISENWKDDAFFVSQFLNGCNPLMIEKCTEIPEKIPMESLKGVDGNIKELIKNGVIYMADYKLLDNVKEGVIDGKQQYLAAPVVLFQEEEEGLMPIAIQLKQQPGNENPVFTPNDGLAWLLAKIWVRNSDFYLHELIYHLLRTHLLAEVFFFTLFTSLHDNHPIMKLFGVTGRYTIPINTAARSTLINETGFFMKYTGFGKDAQWEVLLRAFKNLTYKSLCLPDDLERRGVQNLKKYYYREDGLVIWDAIHNFLQEVVNIYYKSDDDIRRDTELQDFFSNTYQYGLKGQSDLPQRVKTKEQAIQYLTMVMFTCSAQHAAVNHGQYDVYAWMPNGPTTMRQPPPKRKEVVDEDYIMNTLPEIETTLEAMSVARFLSQDTKDFVGLGTYADEVVNDPRLRDTVKNFQKKLKGIGNAIKDRSKNEPFPYEYLDPTGIENSIAI